MSKSQILDCVGTEFSCDGMRDSKDPEIEYIGKATRLPNGKWKCLAIVHSALCIVEVTITGGLIVLS